MRFGLRSESRSQSVGRIRAFEFLWVWRHQRRAHFPALVRELTHAAKGASSCGRAFCGRRIAASGSSPCRCTSVVILERADRLRPKNLNVASGETELEI